MQICLVSPFYAFSLGKHAEREREVEIGRERNIEREREREKEEEGGKRRKREGGKESGTGTHRLYLHKNALDPAFNWQSLLSVCGRVPVRERICVVCVPVCVC